MPEATEELGTAAWVEAAGPGLVEEPWERERNKTGRRNGVGYRLSWQGRKTLVQADGSREPLPQPRTQEGSS